MSPYFDLKEGSREVGQPKPKKLPRNLLSFSSRARRLGVVRVCVCELYTCVAKTVAHVEVLGRRVSLWLQPSCLNDQTWQ